MNDLLEIAASSARAADSNDLEPAEGAFIGLLIGVSVWTSLFGLVEFIAFFHRLHH